MIVSIISPCRNEALYIDAFVKSLREQESDGLTFEFLIADGESDDGTLAKLTAWQDTEDRIKVIQNPGRIVSTGLNRAIEAATGDIVVRMDVHTQYNRDYIVQCVRALESSGAMCVGGAWTAHGQQPLQKAIAAAFTSRFGSGAARSRQKDYDGKADTVYLGAWWRKDLLRLGGYDDAFVRNQDDELCLRIVRSGGFVWQSSAIKSAYVPRNSLKSLWRQFFQYGYWKVLVIKKHKIPASVRHIVPVSFIALVVALAVLSFVSLAFGLASLLLVLLYTLASLAAAIGVATRPYRLGELRQIMAAFACMHFGYGLGFAKGVLDFTIFLRGPAPAMARLTR